ncbi:Os03g0281466 [Oryza sativa Japonica Group]|uniref:Os03g0281466 protein n=2 Tax=Oryza sativa subsp. japonica TaxID=39947 RepID=C7J0I2_ORYSJ|nr:Os03g0281466 [Oryza sativa Japonica Group]BAS83575.1 Os03g0281466 [Oryza sativa Japonica Group]|eukprot:NP_001173368.1 Os03g0281466 [Oryza sativa Japonica Group]
MSETRWRWRSWDSSSISVRNSLSPCCDSRFPRFTATCVPSRSVPLYTFPNPPTPITISSSNPPVASCSAANGKRYPAPAPAPFCPSVTTLTMLLLPKLVRERAPSALAENGTQVFDGCFTGFFFLRSILTATHPRAIANTAPPTADPAMIPVLIFEPRGDVAPSMEPVLPTILMISRPFRKPPGNALVAVDDPMLTVIVPFAASLAARTKSL